MKHYPDSRPRPDANALNEVDVTEDEAVPELDADDIPEELATSDVPALDVVHAHDEAVEIATEQELTEPEATVLIQRRQQENHERTKRQTVEGLWQSVVPRDRHSYLQDRDYYDGVQSRLDEVFSTESDGHEDSNLEVEYREVLRIESIRDPQERAAEKKKYIKSLTQHLNAREQHAEAIYQSADSSPTRIRSSG